MTKPLSQDLRVRVVNAVENEMSRSAAAERFGITSSAAVNWLRLWRETGAVNGHRTWPQTREPTAPQLPSWQTVTAVLLAGCTLKAARGKIPWRQSFRSPIGGGIS